MKRLLLTTIGSAAIALAVIGTASAGDEDKNSGDTVVDAPGAYVETGRRGTHVEAPFTDVDTRNGRTHIRAPFVDITVPGR